jgi:hypothetical protein
MIMATASRSIPIGKIVYTSATKTAVIPLTLNGGTVHTIQLTVFPGRIIGSSGKPLVGNSGGSYVQYVTL